ncbi:MAG: hypothetical protein KME30_28855 [Iphinoe sp. HA4291-MV1]|jgi:hypothetical protein|nr:hypothetical protein [Iphinoe sp. HA4291-MV1]
MLKVGNQIINLNAIAYVDLVAKRSYVVKGDDLGVRIYLLCSDREGNLCSLFFCGDDAVYLRKYFQAVGELCGGVESVKKC